MTSQNNLRQSANSSGYLSNPPLMVEIKMANALIKVLKKLLSIDDADRSKQLLKGVKNNMNEVKITLDGEGHWVEICRDGDEEKECFPNER